MKLYNEDGSFVPENDRFSTICSICGLSRSQPHELEDQLEFHCFDLVDRSGSLTQVERREHLDKLFLNGKTPSRVVNVNTKVLENCDSVVKFHDECTNLGYEGIILRTFTLKYKIGKRSGEMRKYKHFIDEEYEVIGCKLDSGVTEENFVWILQTDIGDKFNAKPKGTVEERKYMYTNRKKYVGCFLKVKFQEFSGDKKIPRFPIAIEFRSAKGAD